MKKIAVYLICLFAGHAALAQNTMLAGKVIDEQNRPVRNATVKLTYDGTFYKAITDGDGLYRTNELPIGEYKVTILVDGGKLNAGKLFVDDMRKVHKYYTFKLNGHRAEVREDRNDPFADKKLGIVLKGGMDASSLSVRRRAEQGEQLQVAQKQDMPAPAVNDIYGENVPQKK